MQLIHPSIRLLWMTPKPLRAIELAGRTCYRSEGRITDSSASKFVAMLLDKGHDAMIEHASISYRVICDRGVTHEIVRHRLFSYAQESTRYCDYSGGVTFIIPPWLQGMHAFPAEIDEGFIRHLHNIASDAHTWLTHLMHSEQSYQILRRNGWTPQQARSVLPNALKTAIVIAGNLREWRHFFKLRCAKTAHPQMQEVANMLLKDIQERIPVIFER